MLSFNVREERLVVISDLHIGNPASACREDLLRFMDEACEAGYSLCINGDGFDIMQTSFLRLSRELPDVFAAIRRFGRKGLRVYYVVGNHDIPLESFLNNWGDLIFLPFLNLSSGAARIRIEHGYLYDPFFVKWPRTYEALTHAAGTVLSVFPRAYRAWILYERVKNRRHRGADGLAGEPPAFGAAARAILERGFDAVIFGHTHHPGVVSFPEGGRYINTGSFMLGPDFAVIEHGEARLERWSSGLWGARTAA